VKKPSVAAAIHAFTRRAAPAKGIVDSVRLEQPIGQHNGTVDNAVYAKGLRVLSPVTLAETLAACGDYPESMAWIGLYRPNAEELAVI
jgi:magnesium transporter